MCGSRSSSFWHAGLRVAARERSVSSCRAHLRVTGLALRGHLLRQRFLFRCRLPLPAKDPVRVASCGLVRFGLSGFARYEVRRSLRKKKRVFVLQLKSLSLKATHS